MTVSGLRERGILRDSVCARGTFVANDRAYPSCASPPLRSIAGDTATPIDQIMGYLQLVAQRRPEPNASI